LAKDREESEIAGRYHHTLRHTVGSTAVSNAEALLMAGAILGHANPRSTAIYAHVQSAPSRKSADRVANKIAAALAGKVTTLDKSRAHGTEERRVVVVEKTL
jgi:integrase